MKAHEFVKKFGWYAAIKLSNEMTGITQDIANCVAYCGQSEWDCLKRLVESYDLVEAFGGLKTSLYLRNHNMLVKEHLPRIKQAIADVESCL